MRIAHEGCGHLEAWKAAKIVKRNVEEETIIEPFKAVTYDLVRPLPAGKGGT